MVINNSSHSDFDRCGPPLKVCPARPLFSAMRKRFEKLSDHFYDLLPNWPWRSGQRV